MNEYFTTYSCFGNCFYRLECYADIFELIEIVLINSARLHELRIPITDDGLDMWRNTP